MKIDFDWLVRIVVGGAALLGIWQVVRKKWPLRVVAVPGKVLAMKGVPESCRGKIEHFLSRDVSIPSKITILGSRVAGRFQFSIRGRVDEGLKQRIRNYMNSIL